VDSIGVFDVTLTLSDRLPVFPGNPGFDRQLALVIDRGDAANVSRLDFGAHTGTHVDAPAHFFTGAPGIDQTSLDVLLGPCLVVDAQPPEGSNLAPESLPDGDYDRVLFRTSNSERWANNDYQFDRDFVAVGTGLAEAIVRRGIRLVGVDYLSVESFHAEKSHPVHRLLLSRGVVIIEGLDLSRVAAGLYRLLCLPLKIAGSDAGPARVVLEQTGGVG